MAIQISGTTVVNDSRQLQNIASLDATTTTTIAAAASSGPPMPADDYLMFQPEYVQYLANNSSNKISKNTLNEVTHKNAGNSYAGEGANTLNTFAAGDVIGFTQVFFINPGYAGNVTLQMGVNGVDTSLSLVVTSSGSGNNFFNVDSFPHIDITQAMVNARSGSSDILTFWQSSWGIASGGLISITAKVFRDSAL